MFGVVFDYVVDGDCGLNFYDLCGMFVCVYLYCELCDDVCVMVIWLIDYGIGFGDCVVLIVEIGFDFVVLFFGCVLMGVWLVFLLLLILFGGCDVFVDQLVVQMKSVEFVIFFYLVELGNMVSDVVKVVGLVVIDWEFFVQWLIGDFIGYVV